MCAKIIRTSDGKVLSELGPAWDNPVGFDMQQKEIEMSAHVAAYYLDLAIKTGKAHDDYAYVDAQHYFACWHAYFHGYH